MECIKNFILKGAYPLIFEASYLRNRNLELVREGTNQGTVKHFSLFVLERNLD